MVHRTELAFRRSAESLLPEGSRILAAVSGGGDSVALLHLLQRFASSRGWDVHVAHLDHRLRRGAVADRRFVERLSDELGLSFLSGERDVGRLREKGESLAEAARRVRRKFLIDTARAVRADLITTGHTLDDQAETVLMRLVRGAGAKALTGMVAAGPGPFARPLLGLEREELRAYLRRRGLAYREDPSNRDQRFDRNRVRRVVLPLLAEVLNPRAGRHLVQAAELFREDAVHLDLLAERRFEKMTRRGPKGRVWIDAARLGREAPPLGKRVARLALLHAGVDGRRIGAVHLQALIDLSRGRAGGHLDLPCSFEARRTSDEIVIQSKSQI